MSPLPFQKKSSECLPDLCTLRILLYGIRGEIVQIVKCQMFNYSGLQHATSVKMYGFLQGTYS